MSIAAAYMVPHPPMIVPQVGRGSENQVLKTIQAYETVASEIAEIKPETIIVTSPHSVLYADYFHISPGDHASGDFGNFRAPEVSFRKQYDTELVKALCALARAEDFPAGILGERDKHLDHGTMVPLYFVDQQYTDYRLVRIGLSGLSLADHYTFGMMLRKAVEQTGRKAVLIASGDLSHKLQTYGPYGFAKEGPEYDARIMDVAGRAAFGEMLEFDETFCDKAAECGHRSFVIMAGALDGLKVKAEMLVHQDVTGVGYGICTYLAEGSDENRHFLQQYQKEVLRRMEERKQNEDPYVALARRAIEAWVRDRKKLNLPPDLPADMATRKAATFVSLHKDGMLRGCIGTLFPTASCVGQEIINNAISACSRDPRFSPVREEELPYLEISVDVLSESEKINSRDELDVRKYGIIVSDGYRQGVLLPDLDGVDSVDQQISIALRKAGIDEDEDFSIERFEVVRHG